MTRRSVELYQWADGSSASFSFAPDPTLFEDENEDDLVEFESASDSWTDPERDDLATVLRVVIGSRSRSLMPEAFGFPDDIPASFERKLLGFCLDMGVPRWGKSFTAWGGVPGWPGFVGMSHVRYPNWVDDDSWGRRYELAAGSVVPVDLQGPVQGAFLGVVPGFFLHYGHVDPRDRMVSGVSYTGGYTGMDTSGGPVYGSTLEEVVDEILRRWFVLPVSEQPSWEAAHVERGEMLVPTREEAEVYRLVGEPLPPWWPREAFAAWLEERG